MSPTVLFRLILCLLRVLFVVFKITVKTLQLLRLPTRVSVLSVWIGGVLCVFHTEKTLFVYALLCLGVVFINF